MTSYATTNNCEYTLLKQAAADLKSQMKFSHRCFVCTLKLPCKHFSSVEEMEEKQPNSQKPPVFPHRPSNSNSVSTDEKSDENPQSSMSFSNQQEYSLLPSIESKRPFTQQETKRPPKPSH